MEDYIEKLKTNENHWAVRKNWFYNQSDLLKSVGKIDAETEHEWLIPCWHILNPPAALAEINEAQTKLGYKFPEELVHFLQLADGARLYCLSRPRWINTFPSALYQRYRIFSATELVELNQDLLNRFRHTYENDPAFRGKSLNYVAFCDAHNDNYLAILLRGRGKGKVFFLDHEYLYLPYGRLSADSYYTIANSLKEWLELVVTTRGWAGFGEDVPML
jgi:hypothetical protein